MKRFRILPLALVLAGLAVSQAARGESLAERAPADAVGFASWQGTDALGKGYDGSHLKGIIEALQLPQLLQRAMDEETGKLDADKQAQGKAGKDFLLQLLKSPTGIYVGPVDFANPAKPQPKIAIFSHVGREKAAALAEQLKGLITDEALNEQMKDMPHSIKASGEYIVLTLGTLPDFEKRFSDAPPADSLANAAGYKTAAAQVSAAKGDSAVMFYMDGEAAVKMLNDAVGAFGGGMGEQAWPVISNVLGVGALRHCAMAGNFDGADWSTQAFIGLAEKRTGYLAMLDSKKLPDETLKLVPKAVTWAGIFRFDGPRFYADVRDAMVQQDPQNGGGNFDMGLKQFFAFTGVDLQKDILEALDDAFVLYGVTDGKPQSFKNAVIINKPKDAQKIETAITTLETVMGTMMNRGGGGAAEVEFKTEPLAAPSDKATAHLIITPALSPAWTVHNGVLYFSFSKAGLQSAVDNAGKGGAITENQQFVEAWKKVGLKDMAAFSYVDLTKVAAELHPLLAQFLEEQHGGEKIPFVLPPMEKIAPHLGQALTVSWTDKDGYHVKGTGPFPLADMLRPEQLMQMLVMLGMDKH